MNATTLNVVIAVATFVCSVGVSAFVSGTHWGQLQRDVRMVNDRLAKIEGMFTLRLRDPSD